MVGIPCSGKSTWVSKFIEDNDEHIVISRDDIRRDRFNTQYDPKIEPEVFAIEYNMVLNALQSGKCIIIDDCNVNKKTLEGWRTLAKKYKYRFQIKFMRISLEKALSRNKSRTERIVPESIIRSMYKQLLSP